MNFIPIVSGVLITMISYMAFPSIRMLINRGKFAPKRAQRIALWNSIVIGLIFCVLTTELSNGNLTWNAAPAVLYYWINKAVLTGKDIQDSDDTNYIEKTEKLKKMFFTILKIIVVLFLSVITSELILMALLGNSVEGILALSLVFLIAIPFFVLYYWLFSLKRRKLTKVTVIIFVLSFALLISLIVISVLLSKGFSNKEISPSYSQELDYNVSDVPSFADWVEQKNEDSFNTTSDTTSYSSSNSDEKDGLSMQEKWAREFETALEQIEKNNDSTQISSTNKQDEFDKAFYEALERRKEEKQDLLYSCDYSYSQNNYEYKSICLAVGCDNLPNSLNFYCGEHACAKNGCSSERTYSSSFCRRHKCDSIGCDNGANEDGDYCNEHACAESGCFREREYSGKYCSWHECDEVGCENKAKDYGSYCSEHECADRYCSSSKAPLSDYCFVHDD